MRKQLARPLTSPWCFRRWNTRCQSVSKTRTLHLQSAHRYVLATLLHRRCYLLAYSHAVCQNVSFTIVPSLLSKLRRAGGGGSVLLYVRRTQLFSDSIVDPVYWVPPNLVTNNYFEKLPPVPIDPDTGTFTVNLGTSTTRPTAIEAVLKTERSVPVTTGVNEIITLSTIQMHRGVSQPTATPVKSFNQLLNHVITRVAVSAR